MDKPPPDAGSMERAASGGTSEIFCQVGISARIQAVRRVDRRSIGGFSPARAVFPVSFQASTKTTRPLATPDSHRNPPHRQPEHTVVFQCVYKQSSFAVIICRLLHFYKAYVAAPRCQAEIIADGDNDFGGLAHGFRPDSSRRSAITSFFRNFNRSRCSRRSCPGLPSRVRAVF